MTCAGCGGPTEVDLRYHDGRTRKWCSEKCRKASYGYPCLDCGRTIGKDGEQKSKRCGECHARHRWEATHRWIIDSYADWVARTGDQPGAMDWNIQLTRKKAHPDRLARLNELHAERRWPSASVVQEHFGTWNGFIEEMGGTPITPGHRRDEEMWRKHLRGNRAAEMEPELVLVLVEMYEHEKLSLREIAERTGIGRDRIRARLLREGVTFRRRGFQPGNTHARKREPVGGNTR